MMRKAAAKARQRETLSNIDKHLKEMEEKENYSFEKSFGSVETYCSSCLCQKMTLSPVLIELVIDNVNWKKDIGERLRRVWEWWRMILNEKSNSLPAFEKAEGRTGMGEQVYRHGRGAFFS